MRPLRAIIWVLLSGCAVPRIPTSTQPSDAREDALAPRSERVERLLGRMRLEEKLGQLNQLSWPEVESPENLQRLEQAIVDGRVGSLLNTYGAARTAHLQRLALERTRLGIPLLFGHDVIHGFRTTFPVPLGEAASFDPALVERAARVAAKEASAAGVHWTFAPMVDVARDPRWGRIVEGAGEDPYLGAIMAAARVRGFQGADLRAKDAVLACAKLFAAYGGAEGGRDYNTVDISQATLRNVYLPPFRAAVDAGVATFMSAFNEIGGTPATADHDLLTGVLKREWRFGGFVVSDWNAIAELEPHGVVADRAAAGLLALRAGVDMDMVSEVYIKELLTRAKAGELSDEIRSRIDEAVRRVLFAKERLGLLDDPLRAIDPEREKAMMLSAEHRAAARETAEKAVVLLKNEGDLLPLAASLRSIALIGPLAASRDAPLGPWSGVGRAEEVVSVKEGLERRLGSSTQVLHAEGVPILGGSDQGIAEAVRVAERADAVILVLGEAAGMSGEAQSRASIDLPGRQLDLALAVLAAGKPTVVVLMSGRPLAIPEVVERAPAILQAWFLGVESGHALARVLFGDVSPGGKLPVTFPRATGQIPIYYNHKQSGRPGRSDVRWSSKYLDVAIGPLFPFGHGLSYATFRYEASRLSHTAIDAGQSFDLSLRVSNTGRRTADEVVQLYARDVVASITRPVKELIGFRRVTLAPGQSVEVVFHVPAAALGFYRGQEHVVEAGKTELMIGSSSADIRWQGQVEITGGTVEHSPPRLTTVEVVEDRPEARRRTTSRAP